MSTAQTPFAASALDQMLAAGESERLALFSERIRADELAETLAALANRNGGTVVIGIAGRTRPRVEGVKAPDDVQELALDASLTVAPPLLLPVPEQLHMEGRTLLRVTVPAGLPNVYSVHGKYLWRAGPANVPIPAHHLRQRLLERGDTGWDKLVPP